MSPTATRVDGLRGGRCRRGRWAGGVCRGRVAARTRVSDQADAMRSAELATETGLTTVSLILALVRCRWARRIVVTKQLQWRPMHCARASPSLRLLVVVAAAAVRAGGRPRTPQETAPEPGFAGATGRPSSSANTSGIDIRFKTQLDWRTFDPEIERGLFDLRVRRGGINGEIGNHVEFQIERGSGSSESGPRGATSSSAGGPFVRSRSSVGRFKVPFGREELISFSDVDFAYPRSGLDHYSAGARQGRHGPMAGSSGAD